MKIAALIVAAGKGVRTGEADPKQFAMLAGKAVIAHSYDAFAAHPAVADIYVVIGEGQSAFLDAALAGRRPSGVVTGGAERQDSVRAGLAMINADVVLIHDAARPLVSSDVIDRLIAALANADGAVPALPVADTLAHAGDRLGAVVDRSALVRVQTPQAFHLDAIMTSHAAWQGSPATDDAQIARAAGFRIVTVSGDHRLDKITFPGDAERLEAILGVSMVSRIGMGFDVHRFEAGLPLWLCGVEIEHSHGLVGHSDADVALHAITDALLGAVSAGDIGSHFPPSDPQWRGAASARFVEHARTIIENMGAKIDHVDLTLICEAPKIGPHRLAMRERLAQLLRVPIASVSVKATTTERLGFTGRGEGIAAQAIATVSTRRTQ